MARQETREIATYLRNGSLWVGHFVVGAGGLDFGDDRFDAAHGLAKLVRADPARSARDADPQVQTSKPPAAQAGGGKTASLTKSRTVIAQLKRAA